LTAPLHEAVRDEGERQPVTTTASPGTAARYHLVRMNACPSWIIDPQSGVGAGTPRPR